MKRHYIKVVTYFTTFTIGVAASSVLNGIKQKDIWDFPAVNYSVQQPAVAIPPSVVEADEPRNPEIVFAGGRLRIVPGEVNLKDERLRYEINVTYPQIVGAEDLHIRKLNRRLKQLATKDDWPLYPTDADLRYYREKWPDVFNYVYVDYEVRWATDSFLSIYFEGSSYGIGAGHPVQYSFVMNYDFALRKEVKLSDIFTPRSKYLDFISRYCTNEFSKQSTLMFEEALIPKPANFASWNVTRDAIRFNFDECSVFGCSSGEQKVEIPFAELEAFLNVHARKTLSKK